MTDGDIRGRTSVVPATSSPNSGGGTSTLAPVVVTSGSGSGSRLGPGSSSFGTNPPPPPPPPLPNIQINGALYHTSNNPNQVDFSYSVTGAITSFTIGFFYSTDEHWDSTDIAAPTLSVTVSPGANPHTASIQFLTAVPGDSFRPYRIVVADPFNTIAESDETDNASNALLRPFVDLKTDMSTYTLMDNAVITTTVFPPAVGTAVIQGVRNGSGASPTTLGNGPTLNYTLRLAGRFDLSAYVTAGGLRFDTPPKSVTVRFPSYAQITANTAVGNYAIESWNNTLAYAQNNAGAPDATGAYPNSLRREEAFWIELDTSTGNYLKTTTIYGPALGPDERGYVVPGPKPADNPSAPQLSDGSAVYVVAFFHTHTPTAYRTQGRPVGPSVEDQYFLENNNVVGIVYDYIGVSGVGVPAGFPLHSPAQLYPKGPNMRNLT